MDDFIPNPANYVMKGNPAKQQPVPPAAPEIDPTDVKRLEALSQPQLIALCRRMAKQCGLVAMMTKEETAQAMLDTLAHTALKPVVAGLNMKADIDSRLKAIDRWLDRVDGKAVQRIEQKVQHMGVGMAGDMTNDELTQEIRKLSNAGYLPAGVKLLPSGDLDIVEVEYDEVKPEYS